RRANGQPKDDSTGDCGNRGGLQGHEGRVEGEVHGRLWRLLAELRLREERDDAILWLDCAAVVDNGELRVRGGRPFSLYPADALAGTQDDKLLFRLYPVTYSAV